MPHLHQSVCVRFFLFFWSLRNCLQIFLPGTETKREDVVRTLRSIHSNESHQHSGSRELAAGPQNARTERYDEGRNMACLRVTHKKIRGKNRSRFLRNRPDESEFLPAQRRACAVSHQKCRKRNTRKWWFWVWDRTNKAPATTRKGRWCTWWSPYTGTQLHIQRRASV